MDLVLMRQVVVNNETGDVVHGRTFWMRSPYGIKELARRRKTNKITKRSRRRNREHRH